METYPPLKAPIGFLTGAVVTTESASRLEVWKVREADKGRLLRVIRRGRGPRNFDAIISCGIWMNLRMIVDRV